MRAWLVVVVVALLGLAGCRDSPAARPSPPPRPLPAAAAAPAPLTYRVVAHHRLPLRVRGLAVHADHVAYVRGAGRLTWTSWRTGAAVTAYRSHGRLTMLPGGGRWCHLVDATAPGRLLTLDLSTGRVSWAARRGRATLVGELNDERIEVVHRLAHGRRGTPADLYLVDQQPHPDTPRRRLTRGGRVVAAAYDGRHQLVWTERLPRIADPHTLWTADLFRPQQPPTPVPVPEGRPFTPIAGAGYVGWTADALHLWLAPVSGGPATAVPGDLAADTWPSASGRLTARVVRDHGHDRLEVLRVDAP
ncbi:hypothetical protein G5V58_08790 [Nocardioides anomalus]|uniref:Uncharacterized protein n=1 Tax=Nocardioides anomalus TaxID=2712223 RepID=A0A6G6WBX9_9ACTN|nr:hypothetical protein [Nocardioides anomalus]QIG42851.1 hypothetical protein G5V58_08790 [Nocardioides anomalus]